MATWTNLLTNSTAGSGNSAVPMNVQYYIKSVTRNSASQATVKFGIRFTPYGSYWTTNSIAAFIGSTRYWAFNSSSGSNKAYAGTYYYAKSTSASTTTSEYTDLSITITGLTATQTSGSFEIGLGWDAYTPSKKTTKSISVTIPSWIQAPSGLTCALSSKTETTVTLTGGATNNGGAAITASGYQYSTNNSTWSAFSNGTTKLSPNTTYWFRYYATNSAGTSYSGSVQIATYQYPYVSGIVSNPLVIGNEQKISLYNPLSRTVDVYMVKDTVGGTELYTGSTNGTSISFTPSYDTLYSSIPSSQEGTAVYYCIYSSQRVSTTNGKYKIKGDEKPIFSASNIKNLIESLKTSITGSNTKFIQGHNKLTGTISPMTALNGASGGYYSISSGLLNPISKEHTGSNISFELNNVTTNVINVTAVDSRGLTTSASASINLIDYFDPYFDTGSLNLVRKDGVGKYANLKLHGFYKNWSGLSQNNKMQNLKYRWRKNSSTSSWSSWIAVSTGLTNTNGEFNVEATLNTEFSNAEEYLLQLQISDLLETIESQELILSTANAFIWKDLANKRVGINKKPEHTLDVGGNENAGIPGDVNMDILYIGDVKMLWYE